MVIAIKKTDGFCLTVSHGAGPWRSAAIVNIVIDGAVDAPEPEQACAMQEATSTMVSFRPAHIAETHVHLAR